MTTTTTAPPQAPAPAAPPVKVQFEYSEVSEFGTRAVNWSAGEHHGQLPVRYRIHHDLAHDDQSFAIAEVWSAAALAWHEVITYDPGQWAWRRLNADGSERHAGARGRAAPAQATQGMNHAMGILYKRVRDVLGPG